MESNIMYLISRSSKRKLLTLYTPKFNRLKKKRKKKNNLEISENKSQRKKEKKKDFLPRFEYKKLSNSLY